MIRQPNYEVGPDLIDRFLAADAGQRPLLHPGGASRPCAVRSRRLYRRAAAAGGGRADRGPRPLHLCRRRAVLLLPPHHPPRRARLRPPRQRHRAGRLATPQPRRTPSSSDGPGPAIAATNSSAGPAASINKTLTGRGGVDAVGWGAARVRCAAVWFVRAVQRACGGGPGRQRRRLLIDRQSIGRLTRQRNPGLVRRDSRL